MDLAPIVITALAIIIILQVISMILIVKGKRAVVKPESTVVAPVVVDDRDFRKKRDENRFVKRPQNDQRPRQFTPPPPTPLSPPTPPSPPQVDPMEKSLRDINLRLKNAERDQESARKKIKDVIQNPPGAEQHPQKRPDQNNNNRPNRGRDDDFRRRDNRDRDRDRNSRPQGGQFRDRDQNRGPENNRPQNEAIAPVFNQSSAQPPVVFSPAPVIPAPIIPASVEAPRIQTPVARQPIVEKEPVSIIPENTEVLHGRKVLVRRRILTAEEQALAAKTAGSAAGTLQPGKAVVGEVTPPELQNAGPVESITAAAAPQNTSAAESENQNINYGR
jgi:hypothetical protein